MFLAAVLVNNACKNALFWREKVLQSKIQRGHDIKWLKESIFIVLYGGTERLDQVGSEFHLCPLSFLQKA